MPYGPQSTSRATKIDYEAWSTEKIQHSGCKLVPVNKKNIVAYGDEFLICFFVIFKFNLKFRHCPALLQVNEYDQWLRQINLDLDFNFCQMC